MRQDSRIQTRDTAGYLDPKNYLDILVGTEDNAGFIDSATDGFIEGAIWDSSRNTVVNDKLIAITYSELMPLLEKRVGREVLACLTDYAANNYGRYPWAAKMDTSATPLPPDYRDSSNGLFGRLPDPPFANTQTDSGLSNTMGSFWTIKCNIKSLSGWWLNWKEIVFYAVAGACKPSPAMGCSGTLVVNPPSSNPDKQIVVIVAGRRLTGPAGAQLRGTNAEKGAAANYLEGNNLSGVSFQQGQATPTFNDSLGYR